MDIVEKSETIKLKNNSLEKILTLLELSNQEVTYSENMIIKKAIKDNINDLTDETGDVYDRMNDIPYFSPEEIDSFKDHYSKSTLVFLDEKKNITVKSWLENYSLFYRGIISEMNAEYARAWVTKLNELYHELRIKESNEIKQDIIDLGWNPSLEFNPAIRCDISKMRREQLKEQFNNSVYDVSTFANNVDYVNEANELPAELERYPLYVVLTYTGTGFGKLINKYTNGIYSHAAVSLDADMSRLYSFNLKQNGFSIESIQGYIKENKDSKMVIYSIFINKKDMKKIKTKLDYFLLNKRKTKYSILNILGLLINKPVEMANDMICSQFVDYLLKTIDIDITRKNSGLVTPNDLYMSLNPNIYKLYEGKAVDYNYKKIEKLKDLLISKTKVVNESMMSINNESTYLKCLTNNKDNITILQALSEHSNLLSKDNKVIFEYLKPYIDIDYVHETKEFPVQFDKDGNLLIRKIQNIDFDYEFSQSHKLLLVYDESKNTEGMKYELSKLWFLNQLLEKRIYSESDKTKKDNYHKSRARVLNDFNKYLKIVLQEDKDFVFANYYNDSPFSDAVIKINKSTLHHGGKLVKKIGRMLIH